MAGMRHCGKLVRQEPDWEGFYKPHKELGLHPEGGLQRSDIYVI